MGSTGYSSPRTDAFPAGLRVLVVDDDPTWLKILEKMLKKCSYEVTTFGLAREALDLLRERKDGFDIVISDVNMPDMDGFKLLEHVGLEMDLPVIMMSVDGETSRVMKGVQHGACDYLLKPIRMKELRNIWQHVLRKRRHEVRDIESHEGIEEMQLMSSGSDQTEERYFPSGNVLTSGKKRKDFENKHDDRECSDPLSVRKTRVVWTFDLHQKFVKAVNQTGFDKVGPKKILDLMGVPWLTRENVASHLQKYRLYLSRLQKEKELTASFGGIRHSDLSSKDHTGNHSLQNSINKQDGDFTNGNYDISVNNTIMQNIDFKIHEGDMKCTISMPIEEPKKALNGDNPNPQKSSISRMSINHIFGKLDPDVNYATTIPAEYSWDAEGSHFQFKQESKHHFQPNCVFNPLPIPKLQHDIKFECPQHSPSANSKPSCIDRDKLSETELMPAYINSSSRDIGELCLEGSTVDLFSVQPESKLTHNQAFKPNPGIMWSMKNHSLDQILISDLESEQSSLSLGNGTTFASWDENGQGCFLEGDFHPVSVNLQNTESFNYSDPELIAEVPTYLYDSLKLDYEYPFDSMELFSNRSRSIIV